MIIGDAYEKCKAFRPNPAAPARGQRPRDAAGGTVSGRVLARMIAKAGG
jgi:hypothetical protein